jgi:pimeloyl-ACP methyl ester carboxylesterase
MIRKILVFISAILIFTTSCNPYKHIDKMLSMKQDLKYKYEVKYVNLSDDLDVAYVDEGAGEKTLLFIHGLGSYIPAWYKQIDLLKSNYRCVALDLPGYGKSDKPNNSGMMTYYADVLNEFIEKLNLKDFILVGHSMGGQISITYSLMYPNKFEKLILLAPAGIEKFNDGQREWFKEVMTPTLVRLTPVDAIETNFAYNFYKFPKDAQFMIDDRIAMRTASDFNNYCHAISNSVSGMVTQPVIDKLSQIQTETLIIFGENDNLIPNRYLNPGKTYEVAKVGKDKIKNSKLVMIPKAGHFVAFEKGDEVALEIRNFIINN